MPIDKAVEYMKAAAKKSYSKKGDAVVAVSYTHLGSYFKLLKSYYGNNLNSKAQSLVSSSVSTSKDLSLIHI